MKYFNKFPSIVYNFKIKGKDSPIIITNMMIRLRMILENKLDFEKITTDFVISDNENLESISYDLYENTIYHWTILFINNRADYIGDFPLSQNALDEFVISKYGDNANAVHHYVDNRGNIVGGYLVGSELKLDQYMGADGETLETGTPVTNEEYEIQLNDEKRYIKVIHPDYIAMFITEFEKAMLNV